MGNMWFWTTKIPDFTNMVVYMHIKLESEITIQQEDKHFR